MLAEPTTHTTEVEERVMRGAKLLDEQAPGWERKIELKYLDIADANCCILGQVYDDYAYSEALDYLGLSGRRAFAKMDKDAWYGFDYALYYHECIVLERLWAKEIAERLEGEDK